MFKLNKKEKTKLSKLAGNIYNSSLMGGKEALGSNYSESFVLPFKREDFCGTRTQMAIQNSTGDFEAQIGYGLSPDGVCIRIYLEELIKMYSLKMHTEFANRANKVSILIYSGLRGHESKTLVHQIDTADIYDAITLRRVISGLSIPIITSQSVFSRSSAFHPSIFNDSLDFAEKMIKATEKILDFKEGEDKKVATETLSEPEPSPTYQPLQYVLAEKGPSTRPMYPAAIKELTELATTIFRTANLAGKAGLFASYPASFGDAFINDNFGIINPVVPMTTLPGNVKGEMAYNISRDGVCVRIYLEELIRKYSLALRTEFANVENKVCILIRDSSSWVIAAVHTNDIYDSETVRKEMINAFYHTTRNPGSRSYLYGIPYVIPKLSIFNDAGGFAKEMLSVTEKLFNLEKKGVVMNNIPNDQKQEQQSDAVIPQDASQKSPYQVDTVIAEELADALAHDGADLRYKVGMLLKKIVAESINK